MARVHHSAVIVSDMDASLRFYRDGIGMDVIMDRSFEGDWRALFGAPSRRLRSVFLGQGDDPATGIVELVAFDGDVDGPATGGGAGLRHGFFLLSFYVDVSAVLARLGVPVEGRTVSPAPGGRSVEMVTVRDPDGVLVELVDLG
jgi:glyoxylase I family protein